MITFLLLLVPLISAILILFMRNIKPIRVVALASSIIMFLVAVYGAYKLMTDCSCEWLINIPWIDNSGINLRFGMDGISLMMILLTTFLTPLIIAYSLKNDYPRPSLFYGLILIMEMAFVGVFTSFNGILFYIFWEMALIPAYFICALWGGKERIRITFKFFIFTFVGSLFMLAALIFLYFKTPGTHSFDLLSLYMANLSPAEENWIFLAFLVTFAVKIPIFPFHTWQPDTYTESPSEGTMLLSGIMLKMGTYGLLRFLIPIAPLAAQTFALPVMIIAVTGIIYASVIAIRQNDLKRLFAYSSIAHVGLIAAALFAINTQGVQGSVLQMVNHGVNITGLFMIAGFIEKRTGTRDIMSLSGIAQKAPWMAVFFLIIILGSIGLPLTNGFVGEFLMLAGIFNFNFILASFAGLSIILSSVYMLRMYQKIMLGNIIPLTENFQDLDWSEVIILLPIILMIFWTGIFPSSLLNIINPAVNEILNIIR